METDNKLKETVSDIHANNRYYKLVDFDMKNEIVNFTSNNTSLLNRQIKDIDELCRGVFTKDLNNQKKKEMSMLMRDIYQYREIEHGLVASKFKLTKELFFIDHRIVNEIGLGIYSKTFSILNDEDLKMNFTMEEINFMKKLRMLESQLDILWDRFMYFKNVYINQQIMLNKELMKKKYDIIEVNKLKNKISYNMVTMNKTELMIDNIKHEYRLTNSLNKLSIIKEYIIPKCTMKIGNFNNQLSIMKVDEFIEFSNSNNNIKLGDNVIVTVYDFFGKLLTDMTDERAKKNVIHSNLIKENPKTNPSSFLEKHGCFVTGLICDNTYGVAKNTKIELMDMISYRPHVDKIIDKFTKLVMNDKMMQLHTMENCEYMMDIYSKNKKDLDESVFNLYWKGFKGCIVNCSFGTHLNCYPNEWRDFTNEDKKNKIPFSVYYFYEFLQLLDKKKLVVHAAGNESLDIQGCGMYYEKSIAKNPIYRKYYIFAINITLDGVNIHFSSNQPGDNPDLYERSLCAPGTYIKSIHCFKDAPELYNEISDDINDYVDMGDEDIRFNPYFNTRDSSSKGGKNKQNNQNKEPNKFAIASGTSFSSPFISGIAAVLKSNFPNKDISEIADAMLLSATPIMIKSEEERRYPISLEDITAEEFTNKYPPEIVRLSRATYGMGKVNIMNAFKYLSKRNS